MVSFVTNDEILFARALAFSFISLYENLYPTLFIESHGISIAILSGNFLAVFVDFLVIAGVVYFGVKMMGLDKLDKIIQNTDCKDKSDSDKYNGKYVNSKANVEVKNNLHHTNNKKIILFVILIGKILKIA